MSLSVEQVAARLRQAREAVDAADLPDALREVGFEKAFDAINGTVISAPQQPGIGGAGVPGAASGSGTDGAAGAGGSGGSPLDKIAAKLQITTDQVGYLFEQDGEELHFVGRRFLPTAKKEAQPAAMLLIAAGRQAAGMEDFTEVSIGRDLAADLGVLNKNTWMPGVKGLGDLVRRRGEGPKLAVKLTQSGWDEVRQRVSAMFSGGES